jgi:hypothetical protein
MFANPAVKTSMGAIREVVANNEGESTGGCVLPPCVIMKRGENLEDWALRVHPNLPTSLNALCALAALLKEFHAAGHVYYAFKPSNVAWFSEEKQWMLIDFACAARKGALRAAPCMPAGRRNSVPVSVQLCASCMRCALRCSSHAARRYAGSVCGCARGEGRAGRKCARSTTGGAVQACAPG